MERHGKRHGAREEAHAWLNRIQRLADEVKEAGERHYEPDIVTLPTVGRLRDSAYVLVQLLHQLEVGGCVAGGGSRERELRGQDLQMGRPPIGRPGEGVCNRRPLQA